MSSEPRSVSATLLSGVSCFNQRLGEAKTQAGIIMVSDFSGM